MSDFIKIRIRDEQVLATFEGIERRTTDMTPLMRAISAILADGVEQAFAAERDPKTGRSWPKLSNVTIRRREASGHWPGKKLQVSGRLAASFVPRYGEDFAASGTNVPYARTQQFGARRGKFGRGRYKTRKGSFPIPWGNIPPRPILGLSRESRSDILDLVGRYLAE